MATSGFLLGLCLEPCDGEPPPGPFCITIGGCLYGAGTPGLDTIEGAEVTLSHAGSGYTETRTTDAEGKACFTPGAGTASYAYSVTPPSGSGYAAKSGTLSYTSGQTSDGINLAADSSNVCVPCCSKPVPKALAAGTALGTLSLAYGTMPTGPALPLGYGYPGDMLGWYGEVTGYLAAATDQSGLSTVPCPPIPGDDGMPCIYGRNDAASNYLGADLPTGGTITWKYWLFCDPNTGKWVMVKAGFWIAAWFPQDQADCSPPLSLNACWVEALLAGSSTRGVDEAAEATPGYTCGPLNLSFSFVRTAVRYNSVTIFSGTPFFSDPALPGWAETVTVTP